MIRMHASSDGIEWFQDTLSKRELLKIIQHIIQMIDNK